MIEFKNVTYTYANTDACAVSGINLTVRPGELKVVTGPSGCGKTTLMRLANGLCPQIYGGRLTGSVSVSGLDVSTTPVADLSELIGTLFQDPEEQFFALNVADEIAFALRCRGMAADDVRRRTESAARRLGISHLLGHDIHALSEGQKQKVGLAAILALGPRTLIFDEPSANLDPESTEALALTLAELKKEGSAILVVDHRLYWLKDVADAVCIMARGQIVNAGPFAMLEDDQLRASRGLRQSVVADPRMTLEAVPVRHDAALTLQNAVFSVKDLSFAYDEGKPIFEHASFAIAAGVTALVGDNGTGKTTLARILTGLNLAQGAFFINGQKVGKDGLMPHAGLVLQNADHQLQMRTVFEEVACACAAGDLVKKGEKGGKALWRTRLGSRGLKAYEKDVAAILHQLNLSHLASRHPQSLSGGEKQRVVIACAVAKKPAILILDEPTSGLDGANMAAIAALLRAQAEAGTAVFLITHDLELLQACDRALHMKALQTQ